MPLKKQNVVVQGAVLVPADAGDHPEHPIYIPIDPPPGSGLSPEHPIYLPVPPLGIWGGAPIEHPDQGLPGPQPTPTPPIYLPGPPSDAAPSHPIYLPVEPTHPIELPPDTGGGGLSDEQKEKIVEFLTGNLPPGPESPQPV